MEGRAESCSRFSSRFVGVSVRVCACMCVCVCVCGGSRRDRPQTHRQEHLSHGPHSPPTSLPQTPVFLLEILGPGTGHSASVSAPQGDIRAGVTGPSCVWGPGGLGAPQLLQLALPLQGLRLPEGPLPTAQMLWLRQTDPQHEGHRAHGASLSRSGYCPLESFTVGTVVVPGPTGLPGCPPLCP